MLHPDEPATLPGDLFYRYREATPAERALLAILARDGAELSATETLRDALAELERLSTVIPEYDYGREVHRGPEAAEHAEHWIRAAFPNAGGEVDANDVLADDAWPALRAVLHQVADAGADPVAVIQQRAAQREFRSDPHDPARSAAQVLHYRITADLPYPPPGTGQPDLLPGWVATPPAPNPGTEDADTAELGEWLRQRATRIAGRVWDLGDRAAHLHPVWAAALGEVPADPLARDTWIRRAGHVAAYRERFRIPDTNPQLLPGPDRGEQGRARAWVAWYLRQQPLPQQPAEPDAQLGARTARVRQRLDALRARLAQPAATDTDLEPGAEPIHPEKHEPQVDAAHQPDPDVGL